MTDSILATPPRAANDALGRLIAADETPAVAVERAGSQAEFVIVCDYAGALLPRRLGTLGLSDGDLSGASACDIGAAGVATLLAERLDAALVMQNYSRLVIDCNRPLSWAESVPARSEWKPIPGNQQLSDAALALRVDEVFTPYHRCIEVLLEARARTHRSSLVVSVRTFAPEYRGMKRPWHIGLGYGADSRLAMALLPLLRRDQRLAVGDNEPGALDDGDPYTLPRHAEARGLPHVCLQIRQDLVAQPGGQNTWAGRLASLLRQARGRGAG